MSYRFRFRAWDGKEMFIPIWYEYRWYRSPRHLEDGMALEDTIIFMQCTGEKAKNGKLIFEGDVFTNIQADKNEVIWYGCGWHYSNYHAGALPLDDGTEKEIIGNIHQHPELLKQ